MVRLDPLSGIPLPISKSEIEESIRLLGWHPAQVKFLFGFKEEADSDGPSGHYVEINGPRSAPPPAWVTAILHVDGTALDQAEIDRRLGSLVTCGFKLPVVGPIIAYGWETREALTNALEEIMNGRGDVFCAA